MIPCALEACSFSANPLQNCLLLPGATPFIFLPSDLIRFLWIVFICCFQSKSYIWVTSYGSWLLLSDLFRLACHSQGPSMLLQTAAFLFSYGWVVLIVATHGYLPLQLMWPNSPCLSLNFPFTIEGLKIVYLYTVFVVYPLSTRI